MSRQSDVYYLVTSAGSPNYGDEIIARSWLRYLADKRSEAEVVVESTNAELAEGALGGIHPRARFTSTLWPLCLLARDPDPAVTADKVAAVVADPTRVQAFASSFSLLVRPDGRPWGPTAETVIAGLEDLARADVIHLVGGGYVNTIWPMTMGLVAAASVAARKHGARAVMTGQGFLPTSPATLAALHPLVEPFDLIDARDEPSAELLRHPSVGLTADDAFLELGSGGARGAQTTTRGARPIMINAQDDHDMTTRERLAEFLVSTVRAWGATGDQVGFIECRPIADRSVLALVKEALPDVTQVHLTDIMEHGLPVVDGQRWITTRYHPHLIAAAAGATGVAVSVRPDYYQVKHGSLISQGSGWLMVDDIDTAAPVPHGEGYPVSTLAAYQDAKLSVADRIYGSHLREEHAVRTRHGVVA